MRVRFLSPARPRCRGTSFTWCPETCARGHAVPPWLPSPRRTEASRSAGAGRSRIAHDLVGIIRRNATVDRDKKERVRASLRGHIRRRPRSTATPPDKQELEIVLVMQQAEILPAGVAA
ncbi:type I restriction enzyme endonuclease domain-containing protein [Geodermatophilus sp. SYSU D01036]